jgi:hypothetical protein
MLLAHRRQSNVAPAPRRRRGAAAEQAWVERIRKTSYRKTFDLERMPRYCNHCGKRPRRRDADAAGLAREGRLEDMELARE